MSVTIADRYSPSVIPRAVRSKDRLAALDLSRGVAAFGVTLFHYSATIHAHLDPSFPVLWEGAWGVQVFFMISGYVILMTAHRAPSRTAFAWARFTRLAPAFYFCLAISTALALAAGDRPHVDWLWNLTMVPGWFHAPLVEIVYWTLGYELAFYALVWACLPWIQRGWTLWLSLAATPLLWWQPIAGWFLFGIIAHELSAGRASEPSRTGGSLDSPWLSATPPVAPLATWVGAVSYPLYLIHCTLGRMLLVALAGAIGLPAALTLTITVIVALAAAIHHFVEHPARRWLRTMLRREGEAA